MPELSRGQITKANKKHGSKFAPKYRAFSILQNKIEDVVTKSTKMCKLIYGLTTIKDGEEDPFEGKNNEEDEDANKAKSTMKDKENNTVEETQQGDNMAIAEEQQIDQSVQDTQLPPLSPPHDSNTPTETIKLKDFLDSSSQNINPLTTEDLNKILDQSTLQAKLCDNLVLVSVNELQKVVANTSKDKVNPQEPPSIISTATSGQLLVLTSQDTSAKVDTSVTIDTKV